MLQLSQPSLFKFGRRMGIGLLALTFSVASVAVANAGENLVKNGDAETGDLTNWKHIDKVQEDVDQAGKYCFSKTGYTVVISKDFIEVDRSKTYTLSGRFKSVGEVSSKIFFGLTPFDKDKKIIAPHRVNVILNTETQLTEACKKDDTIIKVTDASNWKKDKYGYIAFDVDTSGRYENLPSKNLSSRNIIAVKNKGSYWEVQLEKPCQQAWPAGTDVRYQRSGASYMYSAASNKTVDSENWQVFSAQVTGEALTKIPYNKFWHGTKYVKILILTNFQQKKEATLLFDNISFVEED